MPTIVTRKDVAESLDRVVAASLTNPDLAGEIILRAPIARINAADCWANYPNCRNAAMILHAIDAINRRYAPLPAGATTGGPLLAIWRTETDKLRDVTPTTVLRYLSTTNVASAKTDKRTEPETLVALSDAGLDKKPSDETLLQIKAYLAEIKTPASTAALGTATEQILAASRVDECFNVFDLDKWRSEIGEFSFHGVDDDAIPAAPDVLDCYRGVSMGTLAAAPAREIDYLAKGVLVAGQAAMMLAHEKTLKSSKTTDLLVSLATGTPFLNYFDVPTRLNVLYCSGENGEDPSTDVFRRVCRAKGIEPNAVGGYTFTTWTPKFYKRDDLDELARRIKDADAKFVAIDPAGMSLSAGAASTLCIAYDELRAVTDAVKACGATLLLVHHATKESNVTRKGLRAAAGAGFAEWARQWLLLDRVGQFKPATGGHRLRLMAGGSRGHSGRWMVDVTEGNVDDAAGRRWDVKVAPIGEAKESASTQKVIEDSEKVLAAMRSLGEAATARAIRTKAGGMNSAVFAAAVAHLLDGDMVKPLTLLVKGVDREAYELCGSGASGEAA